MINLEFLQSNKQINFPNKRAVMIYLKEHPMQENIKVTLINNDAIEDTFNLYSMKSKKFFGKTYKIIKGKKKNV